MFIRNGIRSNLRSRGRTALFAGMILVLTLVMVLALGVRLYTDGALAECDEAYRSIAVVEYMGPEYPSRDEPDQAARAAAASIDAEALSSMEGVRAWYRECRTLSHIAGLRRQGTDMPYRERGVVEVTHLSPVWDYDYVLLPEDPWDPESPLVWQPAGEEQVIQYYTAILSRSLYTYEDRENIFISVVAEGVPEQPDPSATYVLHGTFIDGDSLGIANGTRTFLIQPFPDSDASPVQLLQPGQEPDEIFLRCADYYRTVNNYVYTVSSGDLEDLWEFHQNVIYLQEGAYPTGAGECLVSGDLAEKSGLSVGQTIQLTAFSSDPGNLYDITPTDRTESVTVVGVTNTANGYAAHVWRQMEPEDAPLYGYRIGIAELSNRTAVTTVASIQAAMPENVRVTLLDQGYNDAIEPILSMQSAATRVLLLCAVGTVAVLVLFALLFVGRQNETVRILVSLGTPRGKIALWLLSGALVISGGAAALGGGLGLLGLPAVYRLVQSAASGGGSRLRFSEALISSVKDVVLHVRAPVWPMLALVICIVSLSLLLNALFVAVAYQGGALRRGKSRVRVPRGKTSVFGAGSVRYALLSLRRGGGRAVLVVLVSAVLAVTVIALGRIYRGWETELDQVLRQTQLEGQVTSFDGQTFSDLAIPLPTIRALSNLDDVSDLYLSARSPYFLSSDIPTFGGGSFAQERRADWIRSQPDLVAVNNLKGAKEFYFTDPVVEWADGWDASCLADADYPLLGSIVFGLVNADRVEAYPVVVGDTFMEAHGFHSGDIFACQIPTVSMGDLPVTLRIVGVYKQGNSRAHIYCPLAALIPPDLVFAPEPPTGDPIRFQWGARSLEDYKAHLYESYMASTCRFTLTSADRLDDTRDALEAAGYGWPGHLGSQRTTLVLRDAAFVKLVENLGGSLSMGRVMLVLIFAVVSLLGFIISWLMVSGRKREFAIMRGFGVRGARLFLSFFWEQALLCLVGCGLGSLALVWLYAGGWLQWVTVAGYVVCYLIGCGVSVVLIGRMNLMELLATRE